MDPNEKPDGADSEDVELTEDELNRIFFGSEESVQEEVPSDISDKDFEEPVDHIEKNIEKKTIDLKSIQPHTKTDKPQKLTRKNKPTKKKEEEKEDPEKPKKRPQGRPTIWTPEKIAQKKEENKREAKLKRLKKQEDLRIAQLSGDHPVTQYEKDKRVSEAVKTQDDIKKHIVEKRTTLKAAIEREYVVILDKKSKCKGHLFKISHLEETTKDPIGQCIHCSKQKHFSASEWHSYLVKNRSKL